MIMYLFFLLYIAYVEHNVVELRGLARWLTVYPYIYYALYSFFFFCVFTFYLVGYFIRPKPQTSIYLFFSYLPNIDKHRRIQLYQL